MVYEKAKAEVVEFDDDDVITTSVGTQASGGTQIQINCVPTSVINHIDE